MHIPGFRLHALKGSDYPLRRMHNPPHPGTFVTEVYLEPNGRELAANLGVAASTLSRPTPMDDLASMDRCRLDMIIVLHNIRVMKNVTITLDEDVARWARIRAAELDTSVSRMLGELLREQMARQVTYQTEMQQYLIREARPLSEAGSAYPARADLHDRTALR